jgi:hypothetical protein
VGELNYSHTIIIFNAFLPLDGPKRSETLTEKSRHYNRHFDQLINLESETTKRQRKKKADGQGRL